MRIVAEELAVRERVDERPVLDWVRSQIVPSPIETIPARYVISLVSISVVFGDLLLLSLAAVTWNVLASLRNRVAMAYGTGRR